MEIWKDIKGFEGCYQISNKGRVKSLARQCGTHYQQEKIRKLSLTKDGYVKVRLMSKDKDITARVHRLVAEAFIPNLENKPTVNHIDGNKENNCVENLEWATLEEQMQHAYDNNLKVAHRGEANSQAKLTQEQVEEIKKTYKKNSKEYGSVALSKKYGVSHRTIFNVLQNKTYKQ